MVKWFISLFTKKKVVTASVDDPRYTAGWNCADTIIKGAPRAVAINVIHRKCEDTHPSFLKGMMDRLDQE